MIIKNNKGAINMKKLSHFCSLLLVFVFLLGVNAKLIWPMPAHAA
jgi:hypothetical protein